MTNDDFSKTWEECIDQFLSQEKSLEKFRKDFPENYDIFVQGNDMSSFKRNRAMVTIIEQLRDDPETPELKLNISHHALRLWYPNSHQLEIAFEMVELDNIWVGFGGYEQVIVPFAQAIATIKYYLEKARHLSSVLEIEEDDVEHELEKLPLEWVSPAALNQILSQIGHLQKFEYEPQNHYPLSKSDTENLLESVSKIRSIIHSAQIISREKRSKQWLDKLAENDE